MANTTIQFKNEAILRLTQFLNAIALKNKIDIETLNFSLTPHSIKDICHIQYTLYILYNWAMYLYTTWRIYSKIFSSLWHLFYFWIWIKGFWYVSNWWYYYFKWISNSILWYAKENKYYYFLGYTNVDYDMFDFSLYVTFYVRMHDKLINVTILVGK